MIILEEIHAFGHENVLCTHKTTIEITKDNHLTKNGNCILGINASKACRDLNSELIRNIKAGNKIKIKIEVDNISDYFFGYGNKNLTLLDQNDIVFRKSDFICDRTILIGCNKASCDIKNDLIERLKIPGKKFLIIFEIDDDNEE